MPPRLQVITGRLARSHLNRLTQQQQEEKKFLLATFVDRKEKDFLLGDLNRLTQQEEEEKKVPPCKLLLATFVNRKEKDFLLGEKTK